VDGTDGNKTKKEEQRERERERLVEMLDEVAGTWTELCNGNKTTSTI
jgi:hypothetical protein